MPAIVRNDRACLVDAGPRVEERPKAEENSYGQILKSSALVGGSQVLSIAIGIVRTKAMAILLGPSGLGLLGLYGSISDLTQNIAGMGVNGSGVRQIAEASASDDEQRIGRTAAVLRKVSILLGLLGAVFLVIFSKQVSILTFGTDRYVSAVSLLSVAVFLKLVSAGQGALVQGMQRISDLAKLTVLGALLGTAIGVPIVYFFQEKGIVPYLIGMNAMTIATSWWYSRKIQIRIPSMRAAQVGREVAPLLKLGIAFMVTGLMTMGSSYVVRLMVLRELSFKATGLYQCAWTLGGLYVSFILQAMGADFYPRLTANANNNAVCNRMVNEQARVGLLLAGPGAIATLTFAPIIVSLFYSTDFLAAVAVLRWICLGTTLQVITFPMGFVSLAKGKSNVFFWCDFAWTAMYLCLVGVAFFGSYVFHALMTYPVVRWLTGFRCSGENKSTGLFFLSIILTVFLGYYLLPFAWMACLEILALVLTGAYSSRTLINLLPQHRIPPALSILLARIGVLNGGVQEVR
jgi:enterobacterial common antigen flippase